MAPPVTSSQPIIVTAILAGGYGRRLDGAVKATVILAGHPLLSRVLINLSHQSSVSVLCVAERHLAAPWVKAAELPVAVDVVEDRGPLAGIAAALAWTRATIPDARAVVTMPVDVPFAPADLVARLTAAAPANGIAVAESGARRHHAIAYWPVTLAGALEDAIVHGNAGAIHRWQAHYPVVGVSWPTELYDPFFNINTQEDLRTAARIAAIIDETPPSHTA